MTQRIIAYCTQCDEEMSGERGFSLYPSRLMSGTVTSLILINYKTGETDRIDDLDFCSVDCITKWFEALEEEDA